jgi:hypothetical protein
MNTFLSKIWNWIKTPEGQRTTLLIIIFIIVCLFFRQCNLTDKYQREKIQTEQNASYLKDTLNITRNKVGELEYNRSVFATDLKDLKIQSSELYKEVKEQKGLVIYLSTLIGSLKDSIKMFSNNLNSNNKVNSGTNKDGSKFITFSSDTIFSKDNERHISGDVNFKLNKDTTIDKKSVSVSLKIDQKFSILTGLEEDKDTKLLKIFVNPGSLNIKISKIDGALIDPQKSTLIQSYFKPKRFTCSPQIGLGITTTLKPSIYIGFGVQYNLYWKDIKNLFIK